MQLSAIKARQQDSVAQNYEYHYTAKNLRGDSTRVIPCHPVRRSGAPALFVGSTAVIPMGYNLYSTRGTTQIHLWQLYVQIIQVIIIIGEQEKI